MLRLPTGRRREAVLALALYLAVDLVVFGRPLFHSGECLCGQTPDAGTFAWAFEWWPHAILHGENPFFPHLLYAPEGINLAHGQLIPVAALLLAPVTAVAGPLFSLNLAVFVSPVLAAFFTFLLCRRLTGAFAPALVGGWLFGFSTYVLAQMTSHLNLALVFPVPAVVHLVLRRMDGELGRPAFVGLVTLAAVALFGFSPEVFVTFVGFGALALAAAAVAWGPAIRRRLGATAAELAGALALTAIVISPYLYYASKPGIIPVLPWRTEKFSNDLLGFVLPQPTTKVGGQTFLSTTHAFTAGLVEGSVYLGLPLLVLVVLALVAGRRRGLERVVGAVLAVTALLSLGARLHVNGHRLFPLPWTLFDGLGVTGHMLPARFSLYVCLCAAILAAVWLARHPRAPLAWLLVAAAVVTLWPATGTGYWRTRPATPALFTDAAFDHELTSRDTVLALPIGIAGNAMLWQAETHLRFRMAGGYVVPPEAPDPYKDEAIYPTLTYNTPVAHPEAAISSFLARHGVTAVVLAQSDSARAQWLPLLERVGWEPREVGGATLLRRAAPVDAAAAQPLIRRTVTDYLARLGAGDAAGACAQLSPEGIEAITQVPASDAAACTDKLGALLQASPTIAQASAHTRFESAALTGTRAIATVTAPGQGELRIPVRRVGTAWRVDGATTK